MKKLTKKDLAYFEKLLNDKKESLLEELGDFEDNNMRIASRDGAGDLSGVSYHLADQASESQDQEQAFRLASREGKFLTYIEAALRKIKEGTFGICVSCQKPIPKARLEAVPTAKMCIECKQAQDDKK